MATDAAVGMVLVHGIGAQQRGQMLRTVGEACGSVLTDMDVAVSFGESRLAAADAPSQVRMTCDSRSVLLVESHWADLIPAPSYGTVARWLAVVAPFTAIGLLRQLPARWREIVASDGRASAYAWLVGAVLGRFLFSVLLFPLWFGPLLLVVLIGGLFGRAGAARVQQVISGVIGDSYVFVDDPVARAAILERVASDLRWAAGRTERLIVVAHSQGAHVARGAIDMVALGDVEVSLWTLGSGERKLQELEQVSRRAPISHGRAALVVVGLPAMLLIAWLSGAWLPMIPIGVAALALLVWWILAEAPRARTGGDEEPAAAAPVASWRDRYATRDLVPDGRSQDGRAVSTSVVNTAGVIRDHTSYFANREEVIVPLLADALPDVVVVDVEAVQVRRRWVRARRTVLRLGAAFLVSSGLGALDLQWAVVGSAPGGLRSAAVVVILSVWASVELGWRLRRRFQKPSGRDRTGGWWLRGAEDRHDYPLLAAAITVGMAGSVLTDDSTLDLLEVLTGWSRPFLPTASAVFSTVAPVLGSAGLYVLLRLLVTARSSWGDDG